jgi:hypothetical protein
LHLFSIINNNKVFHLENLNLLKYIHLKDIDTFNDILHNGYINTVKIFGLLNNLTKSYYDFEIAITPENLLRYGLGNDISVTLYSSILKEISNLIDIDFKKTSNLYITLFYNVSFNAIKASFDILKPKNFNEKDISQKFDLVKKIIENFIKIS